MINPNHCPLCNNIGKLFYKSKKRLFYQCENCYGIFIDKDLKPNQEIEKSRYEKHQNNSQDEGYQNFVSPITSSILKSFTIKDIGLDFGSGKDSAISKILEDNKFNIKKYDPFFYNNLNLLKKKYNYIACCEVIEHFHNPKKEFTLLKELLAPKAKLYCMTSIYNETIDFANWWYKNDITHIFIYHKKTLKWIEKEFGFSDSVINKNLIIFST